MSETLNGSRIDHPPHYCNLPIKVRALLCNRCNRVLGFVEDSSELLNKMSNYLREYGTKS